jgi:hypothetical protein
MASGLASSHHDGEPVSTATTASWFDGVADRIAPWCNGVIAYRGTAPVSVLEPGLRRVAVCCRRGLPGRTLRPERRPRQPARQRQAISRTWPLRVMSSLVDRRRGRDRPSPRSSDRAAIERYIPPVNSGAGGGELRPPTPKWTDPATRPGGVRIFRKYVAQKKSM